MPINRVSITDSLNAFCNDTDAYLQGIPNGSLSSLTFAAKDIFDIQGYITGGGNPDWKLSQVPAESTAWAVRVLVEAGATMVGKTLTDEITRGIFGENSHYGTPINTNAPGRVPGGSSSGSASAVAGGLVDFALGSDTGGSVRVPASFCGLYGLRPTHGRISLDGVLPQSSSYDTVGWFARDPETFAQVGSILLQSESRNKLPSQVLIAEDAFALLDNNVSAVQKICTLIGDHSSVRLAPTNLSEWRDQQGTLQSNEAWDTVREWIDLTNPRFSFEVTERYVLAKHISADEISAAEQIKAQAKARISELLIDGAVICLPTTVGAAPPVGQKLSERTELRLKTSQLTCIAGTTGGPQISLPLTRVGGLPVGISLLGSPGDDEMLIEIARQLSP